jgi:hypothetical protein
LEFHKHYSRDEARALLPQVKQWLKELRRLSQEFENLERPVAELLAQQRDVGGKEVNAWIRAYAAMKPVLLEFYQREILIKDLKRGLVDFPAILEGKEVFLCWESGEKDIDFWHDLEAGYAGRQRLEEE